MSQWVSANIHEIVETKSTAKVEVTVWTANSIPTVKKFSVKTTARNRRQRLLSEVCRWLDFVGVAAADVQIMGYLGYIQLHQAFGKNVPDELREWMFPAEKAIAQLESGDVDFVGECDQCGGIGEYEAECQECDGTGQDYDGLRCDFCDGDGYVWLPCYKCLGD